MTQQLPWRCFHCDETFYTREDAQLHFGTTEMQSPACTIDVAEYRAMERRMVAYNEEDSAMHRSIYRLQSEHQLALQRAEEAGYAAGLRDCAQVRPNGSMGACVHCNIAHAPDQCSG